MRHIFVQGHHKDTGSQAISAVIGDEHANAPAAVDHQAGGKRTAPCTPAASAGGRNLPSAVVSAEPPAVLTQACQGEAVALPRRAPPEALVTVTGLLYSCMLYEQGTPSRLSTCATL